MLSQSFPAFGTDVTLQVWPRPPARTRAEAALCRAIAFLRRAERRLSRFDPGSELSRLNHAAGRPVRVSPVTFGVIEAAVTAARATGGLFDPTVYHALLAAGYDRDFRSLLDAQASGESNDAGKLSGDLPGRRRRARNGSRQKVAGSSVTPIPALLAGASCQMGKEGAAGCRTPDYERVQLEPQTRTVMLPAGVALDLGGIAKGWLADVVVRRLARHGPALADLGGDIALSPLAASVPDWEIEVDSPRGGPALGLLGVRGGGVATSGVTRRRWQSGGQARHHLIDPRTGAPAAVDLAAVTVVAPSATTAEVVTKVLLLLGRERARQTVVLTPALAAVLVPPAGPPAFVGTAAAGWRPMGTQGRGHHDRT